MDLETFSVAVRETLEGVRQCLVVIEEAAQTDEDPRLLGVSRGYAMLVAPLRDYLTGAQNGRPVPRSLAKRLTDLSMGLMDFEVEMGRLGLHPDLQELTELIRLASTVA